MTDWRLERTNDSVFESNLVDARYRDAFNRFAREAEAWIYDPDGSKRSLYPPHTPIKIDVDDGSGFTTQFGGFVLNPKTDANTLVLDIGSHDLWLRKRNPFINYSSTTISSILNDIITTYTPLTWDASKVTVVNDVTITDEWRGEFLSTVIDDLASASAGEEFGADNDGVFFFRPRETNPAPRNFTEGQYLNPDFEENAAKEVNKVTVYYTSDSSVAVSVQDRDSQKRLQNELGYPNPVVIETQRDHPEIPNQDAAERKAEAILEGESTIRTGELDTWGGFDIEPGDVTRVVVPEQDVDDDYRVAAIEHGWRSQPPTSVALAENDEGATDVLVALSGEARRVDLKGADPNATITEIISLQQDVEIEQELVVVTRSVPDDQFLFGDWKGGVGDPDVGGGLIGDQTGPEQTHDTVTVN